MEDGGAHLQSKKIKKESIHNNNENQEISD